MFYPFMSSLQNLSGILSVFDYTTHFIKRKANNRHSFSIKRFPIRPGRPSAAYRSSTAPTVPMCSVTGRPPGYAWSGEFPLG